MATHLCKLMHTAIAFKVDDNDSMAIILRKLMHTSIAFKIDDNDSMAIKVGKVMHTSITFKIDTNDRMTIIAGVSKKKGLCIASKLGKYSIRNCIASKVNKPVGISVVAFSN